MSLKEKQKQQLTGLLAAMTLFAGTVFSLFPRLAAGGFGIQKEVSRQSGVKIVIRALGARDVALAIALAKTIEKSKERSLVLQLFGLCMVVDAFVCLATLFKPQKNVITLLGGFTSVVLAGVSWLASKEKEN